MDDLRLELPNGASITICEGRYKSDQHPALATVLNITMPLGDNPHLTALRVAQRFGWRLIEPNSAILSRSKADAGYGS